MKIPNFSFFHKEKWKSTIVQNETQYNKRLTIWKNDMYNHTMWVVVTK
jgi:hypothetical protein